MGDTAHRDILRQIIEPRRTRKGRSQRVARLKVQREWIEAVNAAMASERSTPAPECAAPVSQTHPAIA